MYRTNLMIDCRVVAIVFLAIHSFCYSFTSISTIRVQRYSVPNKIGQHLTTTIVVNNHRRYKLSAAWTSLFRTTIRKNNQNKYSNIKKNRKGITNGTIPEPTSKKQKAYPQQTPHSGRHFLPSHPAYRSKWYQIRNVLSLQKRYSRFTEGWYYRLTIPESNVSFAFIISIEDPGLKPPSPLRLACIQVIGPNDEYLVQGTKDDTSFWAWKYQQGLGCSFEYTTYVKRNPNLMYHTALEINEWYKRVESGFQVLPNHLVGRIRGYDGTSKGGIIVDDDNDDKDTTTPNTSNEKKRFDCDFDFTIQPICGWGGTSIHEQKSTGGWLSSYPIFEPHWQVTLADATACGYVKWKNTTYTFTNTPFYAEKNWGAALPKKWYWTQCNAFDGYKGTLSVVAGGGIRQIPFGKEERLGMVSVHYNGTFYEAVPWQGGMGWYVSTWGYWKLYGNNTLCDHPFEVEVVYRVIDPINNPGLVFRAPTYEEGMIRWCRDTFHAETTVTLWELEWCTEQNKFIRKKQSSPLLNNAKSYQGGAEIGGCPWWDEWIGEARLKKPIMFLLLVPYRMEKVKQRLWMRKK